MCQHLHLPALTTNRTIKELKQSTNSKEIKLDNYQSHHQGIETMNKLVDAAEKEDYQSHHQGIETGIKLEDVLEDTDYQSHHQGIETGN